MKIRHLTYADREEWNRFVAASPTCPVLQSFEWGELKSRFGWTPIRLAVEDNGKIIAGVSILKKQLPYLGHSMFYAPRGPVIDFSNRQLVEFFLCGIEELADDEKAISFKIDPEIPDLPLAQSSPLTNLDGCGFVKAPKQVQPRATLFLDLTRDLDDILMSFEEKTRYNVRLAQKKGVVVVEDKSQKGMDIFYHMYQQTAKRDHFMIHPLKYYQSIRELLFTKGLGSNFIAYYKNKPIASVIVFCFGTKLWYMYGASVSEFRNVMPNHLLHWQIIQWAKQKNLKTYDFWGIPANPKEGHPLFGVYRFKKGFGGKSVKFIGAYDFPYSPLFYNLFEHGAIWFKNVISLVKKGKISDSLGE